MQKRYLFTQNANKSKKKCETLNCTLRLFSNIKIRSLHQVQNVIVNINY